MNPAGSSRITTTAAVADNQSASANDSAEASPGESTGDKPPSDPAQDSEPPEQNESSKTTPVSPALTIRILISDPVAQKTSERPLNSEATLKLLHPSITKITTLLKITSGEITVNIIGDDEMSALHQEFCNINSTTDVLTFDLNENEKEWGGTCVFSEADPDLSLARRANLNRRSHVDVDLAVCADAAVRQAKQINQSPEKELLLYVVHGLLHCLGHDDHRPEDFDAMHAIEDELLERIGIGAVFSDLTTSNHEDSINR